MIHLVDVLAIDDKLNRRSIASQRGRHSTTTRDGHLLNLRDRLNQRTYIVCNLLTATLTLIDRLEVAEDGTDVLTLLKADGRQDAIISLSRDAGDTSLGNLWHMVLQELYDLITNLLCKRVRGALLRLKLDGDRARIDVGNIVGADSLA